MAEVVRRIGLSLGADICWPAAFEELVRRMDLALEIDGDTVRFEVERVTVEPFDLQAPPKYDVVIDRLTHWFNTSREWVKKISLMDETYVLNNPWSIQSMEKHTSYCAMMRLGLPIPSTWMLPPKTYAKDSDTEVTVRRYNRLFDLSAVGEKVGYPAFLKPYDGGGWVGVTRVTDAKTLHAAYDKSGERVQHLQAAVKDWDLFVRAIGVGPQVNLVRYDPDAPLHGRYQVDFNFVDGAEWQRISRMCRLINAFFGWDFNSCEVLRAGDNYHPIDFANACPDSQVTSLHYHWPWLVKALLKWSIYCGATNRPMRLNLDWEGFFALRDESLDLDAQLEIYDAKAREMLDSDAFEAFCDEHLQDFDAKALEFFETDRCRDIVRDKVTALYPAHEVEQFTDHFYGLVRFWCKTERDRMGFEAPEA